MSAVKDLGISLGGRMGQWSSRAGGGSGEELGGPEPGTRVY